MHHLGELTDLPLCLEVLVGWGVSPVATTGWYGCNTLSQPKNFGVLSFGASSSKRGALGVSTREGVIGLFSSSFLGMATPQKTSSSVRDKYHFTSSLSSSTLFANEWG